MPLGERRHRSLLSLAAGLVLAGGLAACTNGEGAEPDPTETLTGIAPSGDPSGEPTAERPEVEKPVPPDAMARDDVAGAEAAAQYFLELYPYVYATGDLSEWKAMSDPECVFCASVVENVSELHDGGGYQQDGGFEVSKVASRPPSSESEYFAVWIDAKELLSRRVSAEGETEEFGGSALEFDIALYVDGGAWVVRGVDSRVLD